MKNKIIYSLLVVCLFSLSCEKFLDLNPKAEVTNEDMFATTKGCEDALIAIYSEIGSEDLYGMDMLWRVPEILAQNFEQETIYSYIYYDYSYLSKYNYSDAYSTLYSMWLYTYKVISWVNNAIINIEPKDEAEYPLKDMYLGELYGMRAFLHMDIVRFFAPHVEKSPSERGIPYVTTYDFSATPFSTVKETYELITADLVKAQELLKEDVNYIMYPRTITEGDKLTEYENSSDFTKRREVHMNYYAVTATLARAYWTMGEYSNAKAEAMKVINSNMFPLATKDKVPLLLSGALSPEETIFGVYSETHYDIVTTNLVDSHINTCSVFDASETIFDDYSVIYAKDLNEGASSDARGAWVGMTDGSNQPGFNTCVKMIPLERYNNDEAGYDVSFDPGIYNLVEGFSLLRIPEMYYIAAEGYLKEGDRTTAEDLFNDVLNARGLTDLSARIPAIELTEDVIYNERWKEYFGEGMRWFDMKKLNMDITSHTEGKIHAASDVLYVLPVPEEEFDPRTDE